MNPDKFLLNIILINLYSLRLENKPEFIMLENVKGFDNSDAHQLLIQTLLQCGYQFKEFLLSPIQFSIPNSRQRYYLIARKSSSSIILSNEQYVSQIYTKVPVITSNRSIFDVESLVDYVDHIALSNDGGTVEIDDLRSTIEKFLETPVNPSEFQLTNDILLRYHMLFDLVDQNSTSTNCFTKAYAHRIEGCGSILKTSPDSITIDDVYAQIVKLKQDMVATTQTNDQIVQLLRSLELRYFTPREIANLMCFPPEFGKFLAHFFDMFVLVLMYSNMLLPLFCVQNFHPASTTNSNTE